VAKGQSSRILPKCTDAAIIWENLRINLGKFLIFFKNMTTPVHFGKIRELDPSPLCVFSTDWTD